MTVPARRGGQVRPLAGAFLARFFENELSGGTSDLRHSFFWLIAFLAPLGILLPWARLFDYQGLYLTGGVPLLREYAVADKAFYLGLAMVAAGLVGAVVWRALLIDRRDVLVLGVLPVRGPTIVAAKLLALAGYTGLIALGMHAGAALCFGLILANWSGLAEFLRVTTAHLIASGLATIFVLATLTACQGVLLAVAGPRAFGRLSPWLQLGTTAAVFSLMLLLPAITGGTVAAMRGDADAPRWVLETPPLWFLGLYEWIDGARDPLRARLALTALGAVAGMAGLTAVTYPTAYRRLMRTAIEGTDQFRGGGRFGWLATLLPRLLARRPATRASMQFLLTTIRRVERHRFVLAVAAGLTVAILLPAGILYGPEAGVYVEGTVVVLALPVVAILFFVTALRVAAALPGDPRAAWMFAAIDAPDAATRAGLWRAMVLGGVLVPLAVFVPVGWRLFGPALTVTHAILCACTGVVVVELLLFRQRGVPCAQPWRPERANLRLKWAAYLGTFLVLTQGVPRLALALTGRPGGLTIVSIAAVVVVAGVRYLDARAIVPPVEEDEPPTVQLLNLD